MKVTYKSFYQTIVPGFYQTGDIWRGLPTFGLLKDSTVSGLIVTPACDLANNKVDTVTYLPILPLKAFFCCRAFYKEIRPMLSELSKELDLNIEPYLKRNVLPSIEEMTYLIREIESRTFKGKPEKLDRLGVGLQLIQQIIDPKSLKIDLAQLRVFFGKKYNEVCGTIVKNSRYPDVHFVPKDEQDIEWSAVFEHSVVLFRYPITIPIEILLLADDANSHEWTNEMNQLSKTFPMAKAFLGSRPVRVSTMTTAFLGDLLTRYVGLYIRFGSPDFTKHTIERIIDEVAP